MSSVPPEVEAFRAGLDDVTCLLVDALRASISSAAPDLVEALKWNAPSFSCRGVDCITLGLERKGGVRVVLHRGAKPKPLAGFSFDDPTGVARWIEPDRGVIVFRDMAQIDSRADRLRELWSGWVAAVAP